MRRTVTALTVVGVLWATACGDDSSSEVTAGDPSTNTTLTPRVEGVERDEDCSISAVQTPDCQPGPEPQPQPEPQPEPEPQLGTGDVQITLRWDSDADLDLHVIEPDGTEISYTNRGPTSTGGRLDVDSNVGCEPGAAVENVFWPEGQMPEGDYTVEVHGYSVDGCGGGDYTLTVKVEGVEILNESGSVGEDDEGTYDFTV